MKTVLITGGSRGIGRAMVERFSSEGKYKVAFTYKNSKKEAEELARIYGALAIQADSECEGDIVMATDRVISEFGSIDCLINNAAVSSFSLFTDITSSEWERMFKVNVTGAFLYSKCAIPEMLKKKRGRIINISSMWGLVGSSCEVLYSSTKSALIGMTKALAKELGPSGITVNAIAPGVINTDMNGSLSAEDIKELCESTPLMRTGEPSEIASIAYFLASDEASFITGDVIKATGGLVV